MTAGCWTILEDSIAGFVSPHDAVLQLLENGIPIATTQAEEGTFIFPLPPDCQNPDIIIPNLNLHLPQAHRDFLFHVEQSAENLPRATPQPSRLPRQTSSGGGEGGEKLIFGRIFVHRTSAISGWALDADNLDRVLLVRAFEDGACVGAAVADQPLYRPGYADGHGFLLKLPMDLADGKPHRLHVYDQYNRELRGSPCRVCGLPEHAGNWLRRLKKPSAADMEFAAGLLDHLEARNPGVVEQGSFEAWKKAFPAARPSGRLTVALRGEARGLARGQTGVEARFSDNGCVLDAGRSRLLPHALWHMASALRGALLVYGDEEGPRGGLFKPAWDEVAYAATDYLGPILASPELARMAAIDGSMSAAERRARLILTAHAQGGIRHVPEILAVSDPVWRPVISGAEAGALKGGRPYRGGAMAGLERDADHAGALAAAADLLPWRGFDAASGRFATAERPRVSVIIPTRDHGSMLRRCLESLYATRWPDLEVVIADNGSVEEEALRTLEWAEARPGTSVLRMPGIFNYARINNEAALAAGGELLCFLNNDTEATDPAWLENMAGLLLAHGSHGCVGAKLLWPNGLVQHGGVITGPLRLAAHVGNGWLWDEAGYMGRNLFSQRYSAVTAACMLMPRELFLEHGGFDGCAFPVQFNDADLCLRLGRAGKKILWAHDAILLHHESASRGRDESAGDRARSSREMDYFRTLWGAEDDRFYNPNLPFASEPFKGLAFPARARQPR